MTFKEWIKLVDFFVVQIAQVSVHELPDCQFRDWYDSGVEPKYAALQALENADYPSDLLDEIESRFN